MTIEAAVALGAFAGLVISALPNSKAGCAVLFVIPLGMVIYTAIYLGNPSRKPDALDYALYLFNPLFPSLGAQIGFGFGWLIRKALRSRHSNGI